MCCGWEVGEVWSECSKEYLISCLVNARDLLYALNTHFMDCEGGEGAGCKRKRVVCGLEIWTEE